MSDIQHWPWALNQPVPEGYGYPAQVLRGQHHDATGGNTGVGHPGALKVVAQPAPDGTVQINPGGGTAKSTYAGHENQSYWGGYFTPQTVEVAPTGSSSGGRTDLVVLQLMDPDEESHWSYSGEYPIPAEDAVGLAFQRIRVLQGLDASSHVGFMHVKLAEIRRPANTTIVDNSHIVDVRQLVNPARDTHTGVVRPGSTLNFTPSYQTIGQNSFLVPGWATRAHVVAHYSSMAIVNNGQPGSASGNVNGWFLGQEMGRSTWRGSTRISGASGNVESMTANTFDIPADRRGKPGHYVFTANQESGGSPTGRVDSTTALVVQIQFEQDVE